jgi:hypothetical protein
MELEFWKSMIFWGPGMVLAVLILIGLFRLAGNVGFKIAGAFENQAGSLASQAKSMDNLSNSIENFCKMDNAEHREIIILIKLAIEKIEKEKLRDGS